MFFGACLIGHSECVVDLEVQILQGTLLPRVAQRKLHRTHFFVRRYMGAGLVRRIVRLLYAANYANAEP